MTPEDEEFNRIEMESRIKQEHVRSLWRKRTKEKPMTKEIPAFPTGIFTDEKGVIIGGSYGMSLRDYFAASFLANKWCAGTTPEATARAAYQAADAMLKAREQ